MRPAAAIALFGLVTPLSGCAFFVRTFADASYPIARGQASAMFQQDNLAKARTAYGQIKLLESLADDDPENDAYSALTAQLIGGYTFAFVDPLVGPYDTPDPVQVARARALYTKGRDYGMRALLRHPAFAAAQNADLSTFRAALAGFGRQDVPSLFWTAYNWGQLINLSKEDPFQIAQLPRVTALMHRVEALDPDYYYGGAYVYDLVDAASRPEVLGGDPAVALAAYDKAEAVDGGKFLPTQVMFAQYYCVQIQDAALFKSTLARVLRAPDDVLPAQTLANAVAKRRAAFLLSKIDDFFPDLDDSPSAPDPAAIEPPASPSAPAIGAR